MGFDIEVYYASEINKDALLVSKYNFRDKIQRLGDVRKVTNQKVSVCSPLLL